MIGWHKLRELKRIAVSHTSHVNAGRGIVVFRGISTTAKVRTGHTRLCEAAWCQKKGVTNDKETKSLLSSRWDEIWRWWDQWNEVWRKRRRRRKKCGTGMMRHMRHLRQGMKNTRRKKMKESLYKFYDELPLFLSSETLSGMLGISLSSCYELMHDKDFPVIRIGKRMVVEKSRFIEWVKNNTAGDKKCWRTNCWQTINTSILKFFCKFPWICGIIE